MIYSYFKPEILTICGQGKQGSKSLRINYIINLFWARIPKATYERALRAVKSNLDKFSVSATKVAMLDAHLRPT